MSSDQEQVQAALARLESAHQALNVAARALSKQWARSQALCSDLQTYNLLRARVSNAQAQWLDLINAQGATGLQGIPFPLMFADAAALAAGQGEGSLALDCTKLPRIVGPAQIQIIVSPNAFSRETQAWTRFQNTGLQFVPLLIVVAGISIVTAFVATQWATIAKAGSDARIAEANLKEIETKAKAFSDGAERRLSCQEKCLSRVTDPGNADLIQACATSCATALPDMPKDFYSDGRGKPGPGVIEIIGWTASLAGAVTASYVVYRLVTKHKAVR